MLLTVMTIIMIKTAYNQVDDNRNCGNPSIVPMVLNQNIHRILLSTLNPMIII